MDNEKKTVRKSSRTTDFSKTEKKQLAEREIGTNELILSNLLADGAVWSATYGLYVDRSLRGLTRLPSLRVRAATPRAAEHVLHQRFPKSHGCLELPVHRILQSPWPFRGMVNGSVEAEEMMLLA